MRKLTQSVNSFIQEMKQMKHYLQIANDLYPHIVSNQFGSSVITSIVNFVSLFFLGDFINLLMRNASRKTTLINLGLFIVTTFILNLLSRQLAISAKSKGHILNTIAQTNMAKHLVEVNYTTSIDPHFRELYSSTKTGLQFTGGFDIYIGNFLNQLITLITTSLFTLGVVIYLLQSHSSLQTPLAQLSNSFWFIIALFILLAVPLVAAGIFSKQANRVLTRFFEINIALNKSLEYFFGIAFKKTSVAKTLALFDTNDAYITAADKKIQAAVDNDTELQLEFSRLSGLPDLITSIVVGLLYVLIAVKFLSSAITVGIVVTSVGYLQVFITALAGLFNAWGSREGSIHTMDLYSRFMAISNGIASKKRKPSVVEDFTITFEDVSYRYPGQTVDALRHVNLSIKAKQRVAVVGPNGSGKSTFVKLLIGLIQPTQGRILYNGTDINTFNLQAYTDIFGVVPQHFFLFAASLSDNITVNPNKQSEAIAQALKLSGLAERVANMKNGINTPITRALDSEGINLSGGEAQKLAIARAIYKNASFLILDEPTASLDAISESNVYRDFGKMLNNKTGLFISHRMSSTQFSQKIFVFSAGNLVEEGNHQQLMAQDGLYTQLFQEQAQYYTT